MPKNNNINCTHFSTLQIFFTFLMWTIFQMIICHVENFSPCQFAMWTNFSTCQIFSPQALDPASFLVPQHFFFFDCSSLHCNWRVSNLLAFFFPSHISLIFCQPLSSFQSVSCQSICWTKFIVQTVYFQSVYFQSVFFQSIFSQSVFSQNVFFQRVFLWRVTDLLCVAFTCY